MTAPGFALRTARRSASGVRTRLSARAACARQAAAAQNAAAHLLWIILAPVRCVRPHRRCWAEAGARSAHCRLIRSRILAGQQVLPGLDRQDALAEKLHSLGPPQLRDPGGGRGVRLAEAQAPQLQEQVAHRLFASLLASLLASLFASLPEQHLRSGHLRLLSRLRVMLDRIVQHRKQVVLLLGAADCGRAWTDAR